MWFNQASFYHYEIESPIDFNAALAEHYLKPCPPHARFIYGWLPVQAELFAHEVAGCAMICLGKEERLLPRTVIQQSLAEKLEAYELAHGKPMKRSDKAQLAEELEFELLPKAFCLQKRTYAMIDTLNQQIIINSSSKAQIDQVLSMLHKSIAGLHVEKIKPEVNLALRFVDWIQQPQQLPAHIQLASDCLLYSEDNEKKRFSCKGFELPSEEVFGLLAQGLVVSELSLVWQERIQFTLNEDFSIKRLKCLDYLLDEFSEIRDLDETEQADASLALLSGELRAISKGLMALFANDKQQIAEAVV